MKKRLLSLALCLVLVVGLFSGLTVNASAGIFEDIEAKKKEIIEKLGHGVTVTPAEGMFEHKNKVLLICVIKPRQTVKFQEIINRYPETFAYVGTVSEVIGKFNSEGRKEKKK